MQRDSRWWDGLGDDTIGLYRTNGAPTGIIRDRIAASELDPSDDLLRFQFVYDARGVYRRLNATADNVVPL